jgi:outer membrane protein
LLGCSPITVANDGPVVSLLDAVRVTFDFDPVIKIQKQAVDASAGRLLAAGGQFDPVPSAAVGYQRSDIPQNRYYRATGISRITGDTVNWQAGVSKQFRSGVTLTPSIGVTRIDDNAANRGVSNIATVNLNIGIPLLRGRGEKAVAANENAAAREYEASVKILWHTILERIAGTADAYWNYRAAERVLAARRASEERVLKLLNDMRRLVEADQMPPAELNQYRAQMALATAARAGAEQALVEGRQALGLAMGLPSGEIAALPPAADDFPPVDPELDAADIDFLIDLGLRSRNDLAAVRSRLEAAEFLLGAARNSRLPQVDLNLDVGYQGLNEGPGAGSAFAGFANRVEGANAAVTLSYRWPWHNYAAQGLAQEREADLQGLAIERENLARTIRSNILVAVSDLRNSRLQLQQARSASDALAVTFENEKKKLKLDMATTLDVLFIESQLTAALVNAIEAHRHYAAALIRLRFETASLWRGGPAEREIGADRLLTVPSAGESGPDRSE